jgi:hypothetical protein
MARDTLDHAVLSQRSLSDLMAAGERWVCCSLPHWRVTYMSGIGIVADEGLQLTAPRLSKKFFN